jgi:hypothetical protein
MIYNQPALDPVLEVLYLTNDRLKTLLTKHDAKPSKIVFEYTVSAGKFTLLAHSGRRKGRKYNQNNSILLVSQGDKSKVDLSSGEILLSNLETNDKETMKVLKSLIGQKDADFIIFTPVTLPLKGQTFLRYSIKAGSDLTKASTFTDLGFLNPSPPFGSF